MKKNPGKVTAIVCFFFMLTGCSKEVNTKSSLGEVQNSQINQGTDLAARTSPIISFFKSPFISQINTTTVTDSSILVFDFIEKKSFTKGEKDHLLLPFGDGQFISKGWKYEIALDTATYEILLSPNDKMEAEIVRGSFKILMATFDPASKDFNFITRFKELNGNRSEVAETVFKGWD